LFREQQRKLAWDVFCFVWRESAKRERGECGEGGVCEESKSEEKKGAPLRLPRVRLRDSASSEKSRCQNGQQAPLAEQKGERKTEGERKERF
jgi:hypothetical protein